jgi:hypothetical protein
MKPHGRNHLTVRLFNYHLILAKIECKENLKAFAKSSKVSLITTASGAKFFAASPPSDK